ncbi:class I SAM-dependent methyltransferase [Thalassobaculum sp.]|uniref:class I SAM-dependent methyltransferase n=1 Tax=Thalassobaculum sp. TaxID=2022740 RepID=UPI0032EFB0C1
MLPEDGTAFYAGRGIATALYDRLFAAPSIAGDLDYYRALSAALGGRIVDAACGTGRIAKALAHPGRRILAFDSSPFFIAGLKRELATTPGMGPIAVRAARLDTFDATGAVDLIAIGYYGFAHLLTAAAREACFGRLVESLRRGGRLVIHVPRHDLLTRHVPPRELAGLSFERPLPSGGLSIRQDAESMTFDPGSGVRTIRMRYRLLRDGIALRDERAALHYAAVPPAEIEGLACRHGARIVRTMAGFRDGVDSEAVYEIERT